MSEENMSEDNQTPAANSISFDQVKDERGVPLGNVLKEVTRKLGRLNDISSKIDMLLQNNVSSATTTPDNGSYGAETIDSETKRYVDARFREEKQALTTKTQRQTLEKVYATFPELDKNSDAYDSKFLDLAIEYEKSIDATDPERPMKAAKLAALDVGKIEALTKAKVLQDDNRRSRILSEGSTSTKETKKATPDLKMNKSAIQQYFKIDPSKIEKRVKGEQ